MNIIWHRQLGNICITQFRQNLFKWINADFKRGWKTELYSRGWLLWRSIITGMMDCAAGLACRHISVRATLASQVCSVFARQPLQMVSNGKTAGNEPDWCEQLIQMTLPGPTTDWPWVKDECRQFPTASQYSCACLLLISMCSLQHLC